MKKIIASILSMAICCSLVACGNNEIADNDTQTENQTTTVSDTPSNEAYALSKIVYDNIDIANEIISDYAGDIHEAWRLGIYDDDELLENGVALLASELSLSQEEIAYGIGYLACTMIIWDEEWTEETAQATKETFTPELANTIFSFMEDNMFSFCVEIVKATYLITGRVDIAQSALDTAKTQIKELCIFRRPRAPQTAADVHRKRADCAPPPRTLCIEKARTNRLPPRLFHRKSGAKRRRSLW